MSYLLTISDKLVRQSSIFGQRLKIGYRLRNSGSRPKDNSNSSRQCTDGSLRCYRAKQNPFCDHGIWLTVLIVSDEIGKFPCERDRRVHAH